MEANEPSPGIETVRVTAPALAQRETMERTRKRMLIAAGGFALLFAAVGIQLSLASLLAPSLTPTQRQSLAASQTAEDQALSATLKPQPISDLTPVAPVVSQLRAQITDRNGQVLAISMPTADLVADPKKMRAYGYDPLTVARQIVAIVPTLTVDWVARRLSTNSTYLTLAYRITPTQELALNDLGVIGIDFHAGEQRSYPEGVMAAHVLGAVDVDGHGLGGAEQAFDQRLNKDPTPLRLSIDVRVQSAVRDELSQAMATFTAQAAAGIVMDVRTGEVLAMVSLPDYDANQIGTAKPAQKMNHALASVYEPGSTFKLQTAAMALEGGVVHIWDQFDAAHPIKFGRFTITDYKGKFRFLYLPEVLAYSSNLGAAHIADAMGADRQRAWLAQMGMFQRVPIELPEATTHVLFPKEAAWGRLATMTIGFGQGIAISPMHVVRGTASLANGGYLVRPTILAQDQGSDQNQDQGGNGLIEAANVTLAGPEPQTADPRVLNNSTADIIKRLMRLVVTTGYGKPADVPGYFVGGKTGTSEIVSGHGYLKHANVSAFTSVFPMNDPRYAVYMMLDDPHGTKASGGYSTAGAVAAPAAGRVIARIAPILGLLPDTSDAAAIDNGLSIPLQPVVGQVLPRPYVVPVSNDQAPVVSAPAVQAQAPMAPMAPTAPANQSSSPAATVDTGSSVLASR